MAFIRGSRATFTLNGVALTNFVNNFSVSRDGQLIDISMLSDTFVEKQQNLRGGTIDFSGFFDTASSNTPDTVISSMLINDTAATLAIVYQGASNRTLTWTSGVRVSSYELTAVTDNLVAYSCTLQAIVAPTIS